MEMVVNNDVRQSPMSGDLESRMSEIAIMKRKANEGGCAHETTFKATREMVTEDRRGRLPPGWEILEDEDGSTIYFDHNMKLKNYSRPPSKGWVPDPKHAHCAYAVDPYCIYFAHHPPTRRPLAEAPIFDYDTFIEEKLPSDIRFSKLSPNNIEKWTRCRGHGTKWLLLREYLDWASDMQVYESDLARTAFYQELQNEIDVEEEEVAQERRDVFEGVDGVAKFEFDLLDQDGDTKGIQAWSAMDWDNKCWFPEAWQRYHHLAPPGYELLAKHWYRDWKGIDCSCWLCDRRDRSTRLHWDDTPPDSRVHSSRRDVCQQHGNVEEQEQQRQQQPTHPLVAQPAQPQM